MGRQRRHLRHSKYGQSFFAGKKYKFITMTGTVYQKGARVWSNTYGSGTFVRYKEYPWWAFINFDKDGEKLRHSTDLIPITWKE